MDQKQDDGRDFEELAKQFGMSDDELELAGKKTNPTECVLQWAARKEENNIRKLEIILQNMKLQNCIDILYEDLYPCKFLQFHCWCLRSTALEHAVTV